MALHFAGRPSWVHLFVAFFLGILLTFVFFYSKSNFQVSSYSYQPCDFTISRASGYEFVKPVLSVDRDCETGKLASIKPALSQLIDSLKQQGLVDDASVYVREFLQGDWMTVNGSVQYHPASLMKVAVLIGTLQQAEATPGLLTQKILFEKPPSTTINPQYFAFPSIESGKSYTVHELLYYMIAYSDNNATWLLSNRLDPNKTLKLFSDLDLPLPKGDEAAFTLTARQGAAFFKAIYNTSYLSPEYADYAARLLSNCAFQQGFVKGLPAHTRMWHKFGEWRSPGRAPELHEAGVVYLRDTPYLMSIMTRGEDTEKLATAIRRIAGKIGEKVSGP